MAVLDRHLRSRLNDDLSGVAEPLVILGIEIAFLGYDKGTIVTNYNKIARQHSYLGSIFKDVIRDINRMFWYIDKK